MADLVQGGRWLAMGLVLAVAGCGSRGASDAARATPSPTSASVEAPSPPSPASVALGPTPQGWRVLHDFRAGTRADSPVSDSDGDKILRRVYRRPDRLRRGQACDDDKFLPTIVGRASGSFTRPRTSQTAYFINEGWCNAPGGESGGAVAVFEGGKLVATVEEVAGFFLDSLLDLDEDGRHELLISWRTFRFGAEMAGTSLVSLAGGELTDIIDFGEVLVRECEETGAVEPKGVEASVLYYAPAGPGTMPAEYHVEGYAGPCDASSPSGFKLVSRDATGVK